MKLLLICRIYSGLDLERWSVSSTPAILKLIERLEHRGIDTTVLFLAKRPDELPGRQVRPLKFDGFRRVTFQAVPYRGRAWLPEPLRMFSNWLHQSADVKRRIKALGPDLIYCDRANLAYAAWLGLFGRRTVWRCLGVAPLLIRTQSRSLLQKLLLAVDRLLLRFPLRLVVCTFDGSPWWRFLGALGKTDQLLLLPNGVDRVEDRASTRAQIRSRYRATDNDVIISFVGRWTETKYVRELLQALARLRDTGLPFRAWIVGYGPLAPDLDSLVLENELADSVTLVGRVPHTEVPEIFAASDICVALSEGGSLSNTTLEALAAGCCCVLFDSDANSGVDRTTDAFLPPDAAVRIARDDPVGGLAATLSALLSDPARIRATGAAAQAFATDHFLSWQDRLDGEIAAMERIVCDQSPSDAPMPLTSLHLNRQVPTP